MKFTIQKLRFILQTAFFGSALVPVLVSASDIVLGAGTDTTFKKTVSYVIELISVINPILMSIAFLVFFWGVSKFILKSDNKAESEKGKSAMMWGIIALFIMLTFRVIVGYVATSLNDKPTNLNAGGIQGIFLPTN